MATYESMPAGGYFAIGSNQAQLERDQFKDYTDRYNKRRQAAIADELSLKDKAEYGQDMLMHMNEMELKTMPDVASIDIQTEIQWFMRPYLLDFLIEAHAAFGLLPETLFLTINILDRYCSKRVVYRRHYQLVGCTALLIAAKYGEFGKKVPHIKELANMCCSLYDEDMFIQMERHVMVTLDWNVGHPTVDAFLQVLVDEELCDPEVEHMARYMAEIAIFHKEFVSARSSDMAKASLALARVVLDRTQSAEGAWAASYDTQLLINLSQQLHRPSQILQHKYGSKPMYRVSQTLEAFLMRHAENIRNMAPPTPPDELPTNVYYSGSVADECCSTPVKGQYLVNMPHGCLTPPITPEFDSFAKHPSGFAARRNTTVSEPCMDSTGSPYFPQST